MTTAIVKYQVSTKAPDGTIVVAAAEGDDADVAYGLFRSAVEDLGLTAALARISNNPLDVAVANASPLTQAMAAPEPSWGYPPVQPQVPAAVHQPTVVTQAPGAAPGVGGVIAAPQPPVCQHGPKTYQSGVSAKGPWQFWGCNAKSEDPTKCAKEWIR